jgi:putative nucleotidyltransferase with HDIG domain
VWQHRLGIASTFVCFADPYVMSPTFQKWMKRSERVPTRSRHLREKRVEAKSAFLLKSRRLTVLIAFSAMLWVVLICFWGLAPSGPRVALDQIARTRVVSEVDFSFVSKVLTDRERDLQRKQIAPIYSIDYQHFSDFEAFINELNDLIRNFSRNNRNLSLAQQERKLEELISEHIAKSRFNVDVNSLVTLYRESDFWGRYRLLQQGLTVLWNLYREGIFSPQPGDQLQAQRYSLIKISNEQGQTTEVRFRRRDQALLDLREGLSELEKSEVIYQSLFEIMKEGIVVNLFYNEAEHNRQINEVLSRVEPVEVKVAKGETVIELGAIVTAQDFEKFTSYEANRREQAKSAPIWGPYLRERAFYAAILMACLVLLMASTLRSSERSNRSYALISIMLLLNLLVIRMVLELGESSLFNERSAFDAIMVFAPPFLIAPVVVNLLLGYPAAFLVAFSISGLYALMQSDSAAMFLLVLLHCVVAIFLSRGVRVRSKIVRASFWAGVVLAFLVVIQGAIEGLGPSLIFQRSSLIVLMALVYGMLVVGIVPLLESVFKISSDITLLELTDFNHPLLRRMQMEAPGTYHHSLMVANLAEKAAIEVGANPLVCRTCALFHDIGKMSKPEYFTENQTVGSVSPHDSMKPSMSALVIKNHVSEGVDLGRKYALPQVVLDVIRQHHGSSLIRYFYFQALNEAKKHAKKREDGSTPHIEIPQGNYRYDGPTPQFKECAIIFLADSVEAASRSLKKVTQQSIEDLIDGIIATATGDHQLDQAPLSYQELAKVRSSFIMSILNMLHSRIEYPKAPDESREKTETPKVEPVAPSPASDVRPS